MVDEGHELGGESDRTVLTAKGQSVTVRELRERVTVIEPGIVLMRELEGGTPETLRIMGNAVEELAAGFDAYGLIIDLSESTGGTTSEYRRYIPEHHEGLYARSNGRLKKFVAVFTGAPVLRVAAKFLMVRMVNIPLLVEKSREDAIAALRRELARTS